MIASPMARGAPRHILCAHTIFLHGFFAVLLDLSSLHLEIGNRRQHTRWRLVAVEVVDLLLFR